MSVSKFKFEIRWAISPIGSTGFGIHLHHGRPHQFIGQNHNPMTANAAKVIGGGSGGPQSADWLSSRNPAVTVIENFRQLRILEEWFHSYAAGPIKTSFDFVKIHFLRFIYVIVDIIQPYELDVENF